MVAAGANAWSAMAATASAIGSTPAAWRACCSAVPCVGDPLRDEPLLLLVQRELLRPLLEILLPLGTLVGPEPAGRLKRHGLGQHGILGDVEDDPPALGLDTASPLRRRRV